MDVQQIGVIGVGVMGSMLALLFADLGDIDVYITDVSESNLKKALQKANTAGLESKVHPCSNVAEMCERMPSPRTFIFSLPNGKPGDSVVEGLRPLLQRGDIVIDGSNENYLVTQRRAASLLSRGVAYVGMGVSGGFSGARHGPSLMPGGEDQALERLLPLLSKIAARDDQGRPCVAKIGSGGSGHYVKMIHNGIEHGMMSSLCEAWEIMSQCLGMTGDEVSKTFDEWSVSPELKDNFLVSISGPICRARNKEGNYLLPDIRDSVVQDANDSEGTGMWANLEAMSTHVPAPSLTMAHYLRIASAEWWLREEIEANLGSVKPSVIAVADRPAFLENLRQAVYTTFLCCYIQGLDLLARAEQREGWKVDIANVARIWRAGCIIKSDYITDLFERHYADSRSHPLTGREIASEVKRGWSSLKQVVVKGIEADAHLPCLSATLEYLKYAGNTNLPTCFMEAQLDCFGAHGYDLKTENVGRLLKGRYHDAWAMPEV